MTKATTITDTATAVDACQQLALTGLAPNDDVPDAFTKRSCPASRPSTTST